jgi:hypothetical protein
MLLKVFLIGTLWLFTIASSLAGAPIRVTTWNMEWFPSGRPTKAAPEVETQKIQNAAAVIEAINPDVLLLQEIRDWESCEHLAAAVKSLKYYVAVCSAFKEYNGTVGWQQEAILSKTYADAAWSEPWKSRGRIDPPRGYAFAAFCIGKDLVGFYSVHLKSNLIRGGDRFQQTQFNILKREAAALRRITATTPSTLRRGRTVLGSGTDTIAPEELVKVFAITSPFTKPGCRPTVPVVLRMMPSITEPLPPPVVCTVPPPTKL